MTVGRFGGKGDNERNLTVAERSLTGRVFKTARLPDLDDITIADGVNGNGGAWTDSDYQINVGPYYYKTDLSVSDPSTLVHEMTHVWQYFNHTLSKGHAFGAHAAAWIKDEFTSYGNSENDPKKEYVSFENRLYKYDVVGDGTWDDMGFEGQAQMVEDWFGMGMKEEGYRYVFIKNVLYSGDLSARKLNGVQLQLRSPDIPDNDGVRQDRQTALEERPPLTDTYLIELLQRRYARNDVPGFGGRARTVEQLFQSTSKTEAVPLLTRLTVRNSGEKVAMYFHDHLATATRTKLLQILQNRAAGR